MENEQIPSSDKLTSVEEIAVEQAEIMDRQVDLIKALIAELAQYRRMDEEERQLEEFIAKMGEPTRHGAGV